MLLVVGPPSFILGPVAPSVNPFPVELVSMEVPLVCRPIRESQFPFPFSLAISKHPLVSHPVNEEL